MGQGKGQGIPLRMPGGAGKGGGIGTGYVGMTDKGSPINKSVNGGKTRLIAAGQNGQFAVDSRASKEFVRNAAKPMLPSKYTPNAKVTGTKSNNANDLQQFTKGDPDGNYVTGTPLYQAYQSGKRSIENPVNKEQIPAAYRKQVKEYFESINPTGSRK